jgi:Ca2+-transporting ATPase
MSLAYRDMDIDIEQVWDEQEKVEIELTLLAIVGIKDPLRPEVPNAVRQCKEAGIVVRMVTGDNITTAKRIGNECGIYDEKKGIAMEGKQFREMSDEEVDRILPKLQILARSSPTDKFRLVQRLKSLGEIVAVTGGKHSLQ